MRFTVANLQLNGEVTDRRGYTPAEIRAKVIAATREALSEVAGAPMYKPMLTTAPGGGLQPDYAVSSAGVFRLPLVEFKLDWSDAMTQENFMAEVVAVLDAELPEGE